ncbi:MAG: nuclear transport factor 2 family protein, partial [Acetobacteraceae bacterium]
GAEAGYLRWVFTIGGAGPVRRIEGVSEIRFAASGLVSAHLDHWDSGSQVYARLPVLGAVIRAVSRRLAAR